LGAKGGFLPSMVYYVIFGGCSLSQDPDGCPTQMKKDDLHAPQP